MCGDYEEAGLAKMNVVLFWKNTLVLLLFGVFRAVLDDDAAVVVGDATALHVVHVDRGVVVGIDSTDGCGLGRRDVHDFKLVGSGALLFPGEAAACGEHGHLGSGAHEYALEDFDVLLGGDAIVAFLLECAPVAAESNLVALSVVDAQGLDVAVDVGGLGVRHAQILSCGREDEVGYTGLDALAGAVDEIEAEGVALLADCCQSLDTQVTCGLGQLLAAEAHGEAEGVVPGEEIAAETHGLVSILQLCHIQCLAVGIDVLHFALCTGCQAAKHYHYYE